MVRKRVNKIKKESGIDEENLSIEVKQEIKSEDLEDVEDNKNSLKKLKKGLKSKKSPKVNNLRYFNKSGKLKSKNATKKDRGVVYVRCLPHGFYEKQLEGYFGQFGKVTGVYVPKSKKTGRAKGYGFVEFLHPEVAEIAADTMNNYFMFNRLIKTEVIPPEKQRSVMFSDKYKMMKAQNSRSKLSERASKRHKLICSKRENFAARAASKVTNFHKSLKTLGVDYKFKVVGAMDPVKLTGIKAIDPDKSSPKATTTSPLIKSPAKKKTNKKKQNNDSPAEPQSSGSLDNKVKKLKMARKRVNKIKKVSGLVGSSVNVKKEIKNEDLSREESPAKKKKKTIKNKQNKKPPTEPQSGNLDSEVKKLKMSRKRVNKIKKVSGLVSSSVNVKKEIKNEDLSCEESPAKKKKKTIKNKQNKKPPTEPQSGSQAKVNKLELVRKRVIKLKNKISEDDKSSPVKVKQEIKVESTNKKKSKVLEDNQNNLKLKKDFKSKKTPKVNNLRSLSGKLKSKIASKKMA